MSGNSTSAAITSSLAVNIKPQLLDCCRLMFVQAEVFAVTRLTSEVKASSLFPARHRVLEETGLRSGLCSRSSFSISRNILRPFYRTFIESLITFSFICSFDGLSDITRVWVCSTIAGVQLKDLSSTGPELRDEMTKMSNVVLFLLCSYFVAMDKTDWKVNRPWGLINDLHQKAEDQTELRVHPGAGSRGRLSSRPNGSQPKFFFFAPAATRVNTQAARWRHVWHSSTPSQYSGPPLPHFISEASSYRPSICPHSRGSACLSSYVTPNHSRVLAIFAELLP